MPRPRRGTLEHKGKTRDGQDRWMMRASVTVRSENGIAVRYQRISKQFVGTKAEAEQALSKWTGHVERDQQRTRADRIAKARNITVNQLVEQYLANADVATLTLAGYRAKYESYIWPNRLGTMKATRVTALNVTGFFRVLYDSGRVRHATLSAVRAVLSGAYKFGLSQGIGLDSNPVVAAVFPKNRDLPAEVGAPERDRLARLLQRGRELMPEWVPAFLVAALTGVRRGELAALRRSSVVLYDGVPFLRVTHSVVALRPEEKPKKNYINVGGPLWLKETKGHAEREFCIDEVTYSCIEERLAWLEVRANLAGVPMVEDPYIFSRAPDGGRPSRPDAVTANWMKLCRKAGERGVRLHDLRHFAGTTMGTSGSDRTAIKERLGHRYEQTTERYMHRTKEADRRAAEQLGEVGRLLGLSSDD